MRFSLPFCLALFWLATAQAADPKLITAAAGQEFKITLQCNPTTGYQWQLAKPPDAKLVKLLRSEYKPSESKLLGAGGQMLWKFQAIEEGRTELRLDYIRPWEKGEKPAQTTNFVVVIQARKAPGNSSKP
jgi:inhibitor of cysteine peptidase